MDPQTGLPLGAPEAGSLWRSANVEPEIRQHDASKAGRLAEGSQPASSAAGAPPAARKTVSSKSTPNDDASEASTNEAAISEIATPSPNEEYQQSMSNVYPAHKSPSLRSPAIHPAGGVKSPAEEVSHATRGARAVCGSKGAASSGGLPALVSAESETALNSPMITESCEQPHATGHSQEEQDGQSSTTEADNVAVRLHQNLGLESRSSGGDTTLPGPVKAEAEAAGQAAGQAPARSSHGGAPRSSEYIRWLISSISRQLPTAGRAQMSAAIREYQSADGSKASPLASPHSQPADEAAAPEPREPRPATTQQSIDALVDKIKEICHTFGVSMPTNMPTNQHGSMQQQHLLRRAGGAGAAQTPFAAAAAPPTSMNVDAGAGSGRTPAARAGIGGGGGAGKAGGAQERRPAKRDEGDKPAGDARAAAAQGQGDTKRRRAAPACLDSQAAAAAPRGSRGGAAAAVGAAASAADSEGAMLDLGEPLVPRLKETAMCRHLTNAVAALAPEPAAASQSPIIVRVVGEVRTSSGGYLHRSKCIMAFQVRVRAARGRAEQRGG